MTPQYAGLRTLHDAHAESGVCVLGFPCNQFGAQEPGSNEQIRDFASERFGVTFPMFAKIDVNGDNAAPLYRFLKSSAPGADGNDDIPWNFTKFLVGRDGNVIARFEPKTTPEEIERELAAHL